MPHQSTAQAAPFWSHVAWVFTFGWHAEATSVRVLVQSPWFTGKVVAPNAFVAVQTACLPVLVFLPLTHSLQIAVFDVPSVTMDRVTVGPSRPGGLSPTRYAGPSKL